jgi:hypothetical protein
VGERTRGAEQRLTELRIAHIGGPTVLIGLDGWRLLTDPTFDAPGRKYNFGWGTGSFKLAGPAVSASDGWKHFQQGREVIEREFAPADIRRRIRWLPVGVEVAIPA